MAGYGLCKIRKNMKMNKYISLAVLLLLAGCGQSGIEGGQIPRLNKSNTTGDLLLHGPRIIRDWEWLQKG